MVSEVSNPVSRAPIAAACRHALRGPEVYGCEVAVPALAKSETGTGMGSDRCLHDRFTTVILSDPRRWHMPVDAQHTVGVSILPLIQVGGHIGSCGMSEKSLLAVVTAYRL